MAADRQTSGGEPPTHPEVETPWLRGRKGERLVFALLAVVLWPVIAVAAVGGYGFLVWMYQLLTGPPGPPGG